MDDIVVTEDRPAVEEFIALRLMMGWGAIDEATARQTIDNATFTVCMRRNGRLLGLARVVGDGVLYFYISDVIVHPDLQGGGHGMTLMNAVVAYLKRAAKPGATIALVPTKGRESFYERVGFVRCPNGMFGAGMIFALAPPPN
jgi:predicted GNAT family N-acyltransferase